MTTSALSVARPVVLLDCDGPLADFTQAYLDALWEETGESHSAREVDRWAIHQCDFFVTLASQHEGLKRRVDARVCRPGFVENISVAPGAKDAVAKLQEVADVYVVTSPWESSPTWMYERLHWVHKHFAIPRGHVIQTGRKHLVRGDIFVDDKASHVREWQETWPGSIGVLFDMHHNQADASAGVARAGWSFVIAAATRGFIRPTACELAERVEKVEARVVDLKAQKFELRKALKLAEQHISRMPWHEDDDKVMVAIAAALAEDDA